MPAPYRPPGHRRWRGHPAEMLARRLGFWESSKCWRGRCPKCDAPASLILRFPTREAQAAEFRCESCRSAAAIPYDEILENLTERQGL
jgi:prepilin signal peptidase PulO-like enzyme (type II secretory pathway)